MQVICATYIWSLNDILKESVNEMLPYINNTEIIQKIRFHGKCHVGSSEGLSGYWNGGSLVGYWDSKQKGWGLESVKRDVRAYYILYVKH